MARAQLSAALTREVRFGDTTIGLWPPVRVSVKDLELAEPGGFTQGAAFQTRALHLDLDVFALLGGRVRVRRLVLDRPALHVVLRPDGTTNLDHLVREPTPGKRPSRPMDLDLDQLAIEHGRVLIDALASARRVTFALDSRIELSSRSGGSLVSTSGRTRVGDLAFGSTRASRIGDLNQSMARLEWRLEHRGAFDGRARRLALERLALGFGRTELAFSGRIDDPGPRALIDLRGRGSQVDLSQLLGFLAAADARALAGIQGSGRLDFDLGIRGRTGPGAMPRLEGMLAVSDGAFRYPGAAAGVSRLGFRARFAPDTVSIGHLTAVVGGQGGTLAPVTGTLLITHLADPRVRFVMRGDVDLDAVSPLLAAQDTRLSGRCRVALSGEGRIADPGALALQGNARLANVSVASPQLPKRIEKVAGEIQFSAARATVRGLTLEAGQSSLRLDASVARPLALASPPGKTAPAQVSFRLDSRYLDLAELLPVTPGQPMLPNAAGTGTVSIARLRNQKLDVAAVSAKVAMTPTTLEVSDYSLQGYGGHVSGRATFDLARPERPGFEVKARVDSVEADALLSAWTPARGWVHGALNTTLDLSGAGVRPEDVRQTLTAAGLALVSNGTLGPGPVLDAVARATGIPSFKEVRFRDLKLPFRVERGRMITDPVELEGRYGRWQLAGGLGFDGSLDYAVSVTLPPAVLQSLDTRSALAAGALADPSGNLLLDLRVTGSAKAPKVAWDTRAMRDRVAGKISQALTEQRVRLEDQARDALAERQKAAEDSARAALQRAQVALRDSLARRAGGLLKGFFRSEPRDTTPPP